MIKIDESYSKYRDDEDTGYPGGKAVPVSAGNKTDGTPWRALWFNTILGFFQALIVEAHGSFLVNGEPDKVGSSDLLNALKKIIERYIKGLVEEANDDDRLYARKNKKWAEFSGSGGGTVAGDVLEALKLYSKKSLMITNARIIDRRQRGYDIGLAYLSGSSEVYHFDTDILNQNQESYISILYSKDAPKLMDREDFNGDIYFNPAVQDIPPFEMKGRSLYGFFAIKTKPQKATTTFTAEAWIRLFDTRPSVILSLGSGMEGITFRIGTKGMSEPAYSAAEEDSILYSIGESIEYSSAGDDGLVYSLPETGGIFYSEAEKTIPYSEAGTDLGNIVIHEWPNGSETASLDDAGVEIPQKTWIHIAIVSAPDCLALYIGTKKVEFERKSESAQMYTIEINPSQNECNIDELMIDEHIDVDFDIFSANTNDRIPYAALDYTKKWFVLEAHDPALVKTNLFESERFRAAVEAVVQSMK